MAQKAKQSSRRPAPRRDLLESLENRQLMAAFNANFNFQPASSSVPADHVADTGRSYSWQAGQQFGWNADNSWNARDRYTSANSRYDTHAVIGKSGGASKWEVAVPNGQYAVQVTAGDPSATDSHYGISVEGKTIINERPTAWNRWAEGSGTVTVNDGRLTVTSAAGAWNNKITSISVQQTGTPTNAPTNEWVAPTGLKAPAAPTWTGPYTNVSNSATVQWGDGSNNESGFIIEKSTDGWNFSEAGRVGANTTKFVANNLNANTNYTFRVKAHNAAGVSKASPVGTVRTAAQQWNAPQQSSTAPSRVSWTGATASGSYAIKLQWGDVSNESGYKVQRSADGWNFSTVATVGANATTYTNNGLAAGKKYYYRIQSYNNGGTSTGSTVNATTQTAQAAEWNQPKVNKPGATSWLNATANGTSSATLQWGDVSNESGYIVERSTDGRNFSETGRVGANSTSFTANGLNANTKYTFRVKAFNSAGTGNASVARAVTTANNTTYTPPAAPSQPSQPNVPATGGSISNPYALSGISANGSNKNGAAYKNTLDDVGVKNVRIWYSFTNWNEQANKWYVDRAASYKAAGYKVMLAVLTKNPTDANTAKAFFQRLGASNLRNVVDYWQIGNEVNHYKFWNSSMKSYVDNMLKPAWEALKPLGETIVGAGPTWDVNAARELTNLGYTKYVDYAAFHPYGNSAAQVLERAAGAKAAFNNKPIMFTEWNITGHQGNNNTWINELNKAAGGLSKIGAMNYYFAMVNDSSYGNGGLLNTDGSRNHAFYNTVKNWLN